MAPMSMWDSIHEQNFSVAASHDYAQTFASAAVNPGAEPGWSLAGGATVDATGGTFTFRGQPTRGRNRAAHPVGVYVSRSADPGRTWSTVLLDVSGAPLDCSARGCEAGYLRGQVALASDARPELCCVVERPVLRMAGVSACIFPVHDGRSELVG